MPYSQEQIDASIALAEEIATTEMNLDSIRDSELPSVQQITENILTLAGGLYVKLIDNQLAQQILPQARMIIRARESRDQAIEATSFGELRLALSGEEGVDDGSLDQELLDPPFSDESNNLNWHEFLGAIAVGNKGLAFFHLNFLLSGIKLDLVKADLPAVAPPYDIPH